MFMFTTMNTYCCSVSKSSTECDSMNASARPPGTPDTLRCLHGRRRLCDIHGPRFLPFLSFSPPSMNKTLPQDTCRPWQLPGMRHGYQASTSMWYFAVDNVTTIRGGSMALDWLEKDDAPKNHELFDERFLSTEKPGTMYEKRPLTDPEGNEVPGLYVAWITLNNPDQFNSYTTEMVKGVIAGFKKASLDRSVVTVVFTGAGEKAFCTGGNVVEYSQYYAKRPNEYGE